MPEKGLSEIPRSQRELYEKGNAAIQRQNWDYAIAIFNQVLINEPAFYPCREALRAAQLKKAGGGGGFFKKMLGSASSSPLLAKGQLALRNNPIEAINVAEQILNSDPNSVAAHKLLAEAALEADLPKTAVLSLELAFRNAPKDKDVAMRLGEALARSGQISRAEMVYSELVKAYPTDTSLAQALKNVTARRTMKEGGYDAIGSENSSYRDILKDKDEAIALEQENRQVKSDDVATSLIEDYKARLIKEPNNLKLLRSIAELYSEKKEFDQALAYYNQIVEKEGVAEPSLEKAITETTIKKFNYQLSLLDPSATNYTEESARLTSERQAFQLTECQRRVEKYPTDLQLRFELGQLYFEAGKVTEAIQEFQKAQNNPHKRIAALTYLGQCFARRGMNDLAARTFQNAIKEKPIFDDEKKDLIYSLGLVLEKMGKVEEAIDQLKQIYEVDIGYRDVAAKVDSYYASR